MTKSIVAVASYFLSALSVVCATVLAATGHAVPSFLEPLALSATAGGVVHSVVGRVVDAVTPAGTNAPTAPGSSTTATPATPATAPTMVASGPATSLGGLLG